MVSSATTRTSAESNLPPTAASLTGARKTATCLRDFTLSSSRSSALDHRTTETRTCASKALPTTPPTSEIAFVLTPTPPRLFARAL